MMKTILTQDHKDGRVDWGTLMLGSPVNIRYLLNTAFSDEKAYRMNALTVGNEYI